MSANLRPTILATLVGVLSACSGGVQELPDRGEVIDAGLSDRGLWPDAEPADAGAPSDTGTLADAGLVLDAEAPADAGLPPLDLKARLQAIAGLDVEEIAPALEGTRAFILKLDQPEDHQNPGGTHFKQRLVLLHRSESAPLVLHTTGYDLFGDEAQWAEIQMEPTTLLEANQLTVEHRFFGESIATSNADWTKLTIEQSAADSHRIVELLSQIYGAPWVATGVSKGGMTALFHRRFYPDDVAVTMPYVAPISFDDGFGGPDPRYLDWVAQIGPADGACRERVLDMKVEVCERRAELASFLLATDPRVLVIRPEVLEVAVTLSAFSFQWVFWQYVGSVEACAMLPTRGGPIAELAAWFPFDPSSLVEPARYDPGLWPYSYQVANELGSQAIDDSNLATVTATIDYSLLPNLPFDPAPWGEDPPYDPQAMRAVDAFLRTGARHVLGVYGAWDPWTGGRPTLDLANDNALYTVDGHGHDAQLSFLPEDQQAQALTLLQTWMGRSLRDPRGPRRPHAAMGADDQATVVRLLRERELRRGLHRGDVVGRR